MKYEPSISVVIPVRNGECFFSSAMNSILAQDYRKLEVLLIDDGSTDGLRNQLKHCPEFVRYIRQEQQGQAAARNRGIQNSRAICLLFLISMICGRTVTSELWFIRSKKIPKPALLKV